MFYVLIPQGNLTAYYCTDHWAGYKTFDVEKAYRFENFNNAVNHAYHNNGYVTICK